MIKWPTKLTGTVPLTRWLNSLLAAVKSSEIVDAPGYKVRRSATGTSLDIKIGTSGGGAASDPVWLP